MASATLAEVKEYLALEGDALDSVLGLMLGRAEVYVRRLTIIGDQQEANGSFTYGYPDQLKLAQLIVAKFYWDRRENPNDGKSPPGLRGYISGWERGQGNPNENALQVFDDDDLPAPVPVPTTPIVPTPTPTPPQATETYYFAMRESTGVPPLGDSFTEATEADFTAGLMFAGPNLGAVGDADVSRFQTPNFPSGVRQAAFLVAIPDGRVLTTVILDAFRQNVTDLIDRQPDVTISGDTYRVYYFGVYFVSLVGHFWEIYVEDE